MNRLRREDERPSKNVMMMYLHQKGWRRVQMRPTEHEPVRWIDPLATVGGRPRTEEAYDLQTRRDRHGIGKEPA